MVCIIRRKLIASSAEREKIAGNKKPALGGLG
jgi:hypothetical protein